MTPSGQPPVYLPSDLYDAAQAAGVDMRWYEKVRPIPLDPPEKKGRK